MAFVFDRVFLCFFGAMIACLWLEAGLFAQQDVTEDQQPDPVLNQPVESEVWDEFFREYPDAAKGLMDGLRNVQGTGQFRHLRSLGADADWLDFSFMADHDKVRFQIRDGDGRETCVLITPELAAKVMRVGEQDAWLESKGTEPDEKLKLLMATRWNRFAGATYSVDSWPILEKIEDRTFVAENVTLHGTNPDWVILEASFSEADPDPAFTSHGRVTVTFDRQQQWAVREFTIRSEAPYNFESRGIVEVQTIEGLGTYPRSLSIKSYDLSDPTTVQEEIDCEFTHIERFSPGSEDVFTLAALGIQDVRSRAFSWIWVGNIVIGGGLAVMLYLRYKKGRSHAA